MMTRLFASGLGFLWLFTGGVQPGSTAFAETTPISGAVSLPSGFDISLPFPEGVRANVTAGYGPSAGSSSHVGTDRTCCTNDYYALDFTLPDYGNNGHGQPVVAIASGTVVMAQWATGGWSPFGQIVYVEHDFTADGHTYRSLYAHLNALNVSVGQRVGQGDVLGELGASCDHDLSCSYFGSHLHFSIHQDSSYDGGPYTGHSVVPEPIDRYTDITRGRTLVSQNNGQPAGPCATITLPETILDDRGSCFQRHGTASYWHDENSGYDQHCVWTYTVDDTTYDNHGIWMLHFAQAGDYDLYAYIPAAFGESQQANYEIRHNGIEGGVRRDQSSVNDGWLLIGTFTFASGGDQWVRLTDNTGEPYSANSNTKIVFDALRIVASTEPICDCAAGDPPITQECGNCGAQQRRCDGCNWSDWSACEGQGVCERGASETATCQDGTTQRRICSNSCAWGAWSECSSNPDPDPTDVSEDTGFPTDTSTLSDIGDTDAADTGSDAFVDTDSSGADVGPDIDTADGEQDRQAAIKGGCGCRVRDGAIHANLPSWLWLGVIVLTVWSRRMSRTDAVPRKW